MAGKIIDGTPNLKKIPTDLLIKIHEHHVYEEDNEKVINMSVTEDFDYVFTSNMAIIEEYNKRIDNE
jgi:hypothetical protein